MSMVNELNSELAMAFLRRAQADAKFDKKKLPAILQQIDLTLQPLSKAERRDKWIDVHKVEECTAVANH